MNEIKLWIGNLNYPASKLPWLPTIDSVLSTQALNKNNYLYRTVIIFRKATDADYNYTMNNDVVYTSSATDTQTQHIGLDGTITISGIYDYFDGNYYYSYLIMYSDTFDNWNVTNNVNVYAVLYDQTLAYISAPYIMNEWRITKNVAEIITSAEINNVSTLIVPNQMSEGIKYETFYNVAYCENFQLFNMINPLLTQEIEVFNGLLYSINQGTLIAVPRIYTADVNNNIILSYNCTKIKSYSVNNGTVDMRYETSFDMLFGENVTTIEEYGLGYISPKIINFPKLESIKAYGLYLNDKIEVLYLPKSLIDIDIYGIIPASSVFTNVLLEFDFGINLTTPLYLHYCEMLDANLLANQFNNLATVTDSIIYLHQKVFDALTPTQLAIATDKGWKVEKL